MPRNEQATESARPSRRLALLGGTVVLAGVGAFASGWFNIFASANTAGALSVAEAFAQAEAGHIYLIDIRRPDEWGRTGVASPAIAMDMRRDDFEAVLQAIIDQSGDRPVALICARGVRSDRMNARLRAAGFGNIIDVPEGVLGSGAGPGYIAAGLPLRAPTAAELAGQIP